MAMDILITEDIDPQAVRQLSERYKVFHDPNLWKDAHALQQAIGATRAVIVRNQTQVNADLLRAAPKLIGIGRLGVGLDNINVPAASELGIVVIAPLDANAVSVAELTVGLLLSLTRKIPRADRSTKAGGWDRKGCTGIELDGKTIAICGFGRIGRLVAARGRAFGMHILAFDPYLKSDALSLRETGATLCPRLEEAVAGADFVTAHSPLTPETRHMFNARVFTLMKPGAFFINTSRGGIVDEAALLQALQGGHLGGAALDVREIEPPASQSPFVAMENVILTPHIGSFTLEAQKRTSDAVTADIERLLSGTPAVNFVNFAKPRRGSV